MMPSLALAASGTEVNKTADTKLDDNYQASVTLTVNGTSAQTHSDVVFVLDKSTSVDVRREAGILLEELVKQAGDNKIKVGVVVFNKDATYQKQLVELNSETLPAIKEALQTELKSGTNIQAGIAAGRAMLDADTEIPSSAKHLVLVTDGVTYMWNDANGNQVAVYNEVNPDKMKKYWASPSVCEFYPIGSDAEPYKNPATWMNANGSELDGVIAEKQLPYGAGPDSVEKYIPLGSKYTCCDAALYMAGKEWAAANQSGYNLYAYAYLYVDSRDVEHTWALNFISNLSTVGGCSSVVPESVSGVFDNVKSDIIYSLGVGSYVNDVMGETEDYNFDFVNDASAMKLTVGDTEYEAVKISENEYGFAQDEGGVYRYTLEYDASSDSFAWFFNTPVAGQKVSLTYKIQLTNPKTEPGVYDGLLTNNEANLYPSGSSEAIPFPQPTTSYEVIADEVQPAASIPQTSDSVAYAIPVAVGVLAIAAGCLVAARRFNHL